MAAQKDDDDEIHLSTKAAVALFIAVLGIGGANIFSSKDNSDEVVDRIKALQAELSEYDPARMKNIEKHGRELRTMMMVFTAREEHVRRQHDLMEEHLELIARLMNQTTVEERGSDQ